MNQPSNIETLRLKYQDEGSDKFWEISLQDTEVTVRFGRTGTQGQTQTKSFESSIEARNHHDKLVREKRKKGYVDESSSASKSHASTTTEKVLAPTVTLQPKNQTSSAGGEVTPIEAQPTIGANQGKSDVEQTRDLFQQWMNAATADEQQEVNRAENPEPTETPQLSLQSVVEASEKGWPGVIAKLFTGASEAQRSSLRKQYLQEHQLYGTVYTFETAKHWKQTSQATKLLDIAIGNKQELLYALDECMADFPKESVKILSERPATWLGSAVHRNLLANPIPKFVTWAELTIAGLIPKEWDDKTIGLIGNSAFQGDDNAIWKRYIDQIPGLVEQLPRILSVENWSGTTGSSLVCQMVDFLSTCCKLNRLAWIRAALHGMYQVSNQNHTRGCQTILSHLAPTIDELSECQSDLVAVLDQAKPLAFEAILNLLEQLAAANRLEWQVVGPSLAGLLSKAGIGHSKQAIRLLRSQVNSAGRSIVLSALCSGLMHPNREISELSWKSIASEATASDHHILEQIRQSLPHLSETLRRVVEASSLISQSNSLVDGPITTDTHSSSGNSNITPSPTQEVETPIELSDSDIQKLPDCLIQSFKLREVQESLKLERYIGSADWSVMQAPVLSLQSELVAIQSLDEVVLRIGEAIENVVSIDQLEMLLDAICRIPRGSDSDFELKTAAIKNAILTEHPFLNAEWNPAFAWLIRAWVGMNRPEVPDRRSLARIEEISELRNVAVEEIVRQGCSYQCLSIATHVGGWLDPSVFLDRLEAAEKNGVTILVPDLELALLRLAPDGRTTLWQNNSLIERARQLKGAYSTIIRFAMGDAIEPDMMTGSQRLWVAAIKGRDPEARLSEESPFANAPFQQAQSQDGQSIELPTTCVRELPKWNCQYATEMKAVEDGRGYRVNFIGGDLDRGLVYQPNIVQLGDNIAPAADNYYLTRYLAGQIFRGRFFKYDCRDMWPSQLDWYWNCITSSYIFLAHAKTDFDNFDDLAPFLESERPLTPGSARVLWLCTLARAENHRLWTIEAWSQIVDDDRLNIPLLAQVLIEFQNRQWVIPKRLAEVLAPVATRSPLHAWDIAKLVMAMVESFQFAVKDLAPLLEIVLEAYTWLGIAATPAEISLLQPLVSGKSKKTLEAISNLKYTPDGEPAKARRKALRNRAARRLARARRAAPL